MDPSVHVQSSDPQLKGDSSWLGILMCLLPVPAGKTRTRPKLQAGQEFLLKMAVALDTKMFTLFTQKVCGQLHQP